MYNQGVNMSDYKFSLRVNALIMSIMLFAGLSAFAADNPRIPELTQKILSCDTPEAAYSNFEDLTEIYFGGRQYNGYADLLKNLAQKKKELEPAADYYSALTRYYQLNYLEDSQSWDEYFGKGNDYRSSIKDFLDKAIESTSENPSVYGLDARLLLWKFYKTQHDDAANKALDDLMGYLSRYANISSASPQAIKEVGYELSSFDEKIKAKLAYETYAEKLASSGISQEELAKTALSLYKEGNLGLAESIYNIYIERVIKSLEPQKAAPELIEIGKLFLYGKQKPYDAFYAESILSKARDMAGKDIFDEQLAYQRALSLEKARQYGSAKAAYDELIARFPSSARASEASFKSGLIAIYGLGDVKQGKPVLEKLAAGASADAYTVAAIYQLGLLSQWENDPAKAKDYYTEVLNRSKGSFAELEALSQERLSELVSSKPMDYNLKMFMDAALKSGGSRSDFAGLGLSADPYVADKLEKVNVNSTTAPLESGCIQVTLQYLWSGSLGKSAPSADSSSFTAAYENTGPKVINLVAVSPNGVTGWDFVVIDVQ
jgi:TolA-binding protein